VELATQDEPSSTEVKCKWLGPSGRKVHSSAVKKIITTPAKYTDSFDRRTKPINRDGIKPKDKPTSTNSRATHLTQDADTNEREAEILAWLYHEDGTKYITC